MMSNRSRDDFDRLMTGWMEAEGRVREPEDLVDRILDRTRVARRRPRWLVADWWPLMQNIARLQTVWRPAPMLIAALLLIALALVAALLAGAQRHVPAPFGPAGNGSIAYDTGGTIAIVNQAGAGGRSLITTVANASAPQFSPDGLHIVFWGDGGPDSLYLADRDGSNIRPLVRNLWIAPNLSRAWSPDSSRLVISTESGPDTKDEHLVIVDIGTGGTTTINGSVAGGARLLLPAWSPDGSSIAFLALNPVTDALRMWIIRPDGTDARELPTGELAPTTVGPRWFPSDTKRLVAYDVVSSGAGAVVVLDLDTGTERVLSDDASEPAFWPAWSPDGTRLAWLGASGAGPLFVVSVDGSTGPTRLLGAGLGGPVAWSPDGTRVFGLTESGSGLVVVTVDGSVPPVQLPHKPSAGLPDWQRVAS